ncbi:HD domain-containing phosphohydrolase [Aquitalea sp.]|uniref:HD-GYP domain-containing protein n=1 Tax=Aquitalea sp. TaxID=1872623 RepID=UPI0025859503|nr:HD domain-containing phosphohydrolase [Aquitalea sp.]
MAYPDFKAGLAAELAMAHRGLLAVKCLFDRLRADAGRKSSVSLHDIRGVVGCLYASLLRNQDALLLLLFCREVEKDYYSHSAAVSVLLMLYRMQGGASAMAVTDAGIGGLMHDAGKLFVPTAILNKPGTQPADAYAAARHHVVCGVDFLQNVLGLQGDQLLPAQEHHERFDGSAYPVARSGHAISELGQMTAIVDVYDALAVERCHHQRTPVRHVLSYLLARKGSDFNPRLVDVFIGIVGHFPIGSLVQLENGHCGVVVGRSRQARALPYVIGYNPSACLCTPPSFSPHQIRHPSRVRHLLSERRAGLDTRALVSRWLQADFSMLSLAGDGV